MIAIYYRVSTDKQDFNSQRHAVEAYLGTDHVNAIVYEDQGISGSVESRPAFQRLLSDVKLGLIKRVVTFEMSRLSRDFLVFLNTLELFRKHNVSVEVPGEGVQHFDSSVDKLIAAVKGFTSTQFLEDHSKRVKSGMAAAKQRGVQLGGYRGAKGHRKEYNPELVKNVIMLRANKLSYSNIAKVLKISKSTVQNIIRRY